MRLSIPVVQFPRTDELGMELSSVIRLFENDHRVVAVYLLGSAMHLVARDHLGMPQSSSDAFQLLAEAARISGDSQRAMIAMTGFRNIALHQYQQLDKSVLHAIARGGWQSLVDYARELGLSLKPKGNHSRTALLAGER